VLALDGMGEGSRLVLVLASRPSHAIIPLMSDKQSSPARLEATIDGRVQGVSFRYYTVRRAREMGLSGYVRNEPNGTVMVVAEGPRSELEGFLSFLRVGPRSAIVTDVAIRWLAPTGKFARFEVRY